MTDKRYRTELPNIIDDLGLNPYERALYVHYKRVCGATGGICNEAVRTTSEKTKMAVGKITPTRLALEKKGLITTSGGGLGRNGTTPVEIIDIWELNTAFYAEKERPDIDGWTINQLDDWLKNVHHVNIECPQDEHIPEECSPREQKCSPDEQECSPRETKKEPIKKEPIKKELIGGKPPPPKKLKKPRTKKQQLFTVIMSLCHIDFETASDPQLNQVKYATNAILEKIDDPQEFEREFEAYWYGHNWRSKKGQCPIPSQVREFYGDFQHWLNNGASNGQHRQSSAGVSGGTTKSSNPLGKQLKEAFKKRARASGS